MEGIEEEVVDNFSAIENEKSHSELSTYAVDPIYCAIKFT